MTSEKCQSFEWCQRENLLRQYRDMEHKWAAAVAAGCVIEAERDRLRVLLKEALDIGSALLQDSGCPIERRHGDRLVAIRAEAGLT